MDKLMKQFLEWKNKHPGEYRQAEKLNIKLEKLFKKESSNPGGEWKIDHSGQIKVNG